MVSICSGCGDPTVTPTISAACFYFYFIFRNSFVFFFFFAIPSLDIVIVSTPGQYGPAAHQYSCRATSERYWYDIPVYVR